MDVKMRKAIIATAWTILMAFATYITVYGAVSYLQWSQTVTQHVDYAVINMNIKNYTLPNGYVGFSEFSDNYLALEFTTMQPSLSLIITCNNTADLQSQYGTLRLTLLNGTTHAALPYILDLLSLGDSITYPLPYVDTYGFGYSFSYLPTAPSNGSGDNQIILNVAFSP